MAGCSGAGTRNNCIAAVAHRQAIALETEFGIVKNSAGKVRRMGMNHRPLAFGSLLPYSCAPQPVLLDSKIWK
jgi:hypothetical protein